MINSISNQEASATAIQLQLNQKYAQLEKIDQNEVKATFEKQYEDYFQESVVNGKYDKNDYERVLDKFRNLDSQTRIHEQTHASLANTTAPIQYNYQMGPDGKMYAVGGSVRLDTSIPNDKEAAINKLNSLAQSASSSASGMSGADSSISISANLMKMKLQLQEQESNPA